MQTVLDAQLLGSARAHHSRVAPGLLGDGLWHLLQPAVIGKPSVVQTVCNGENDFVVVAIDSISLDGSWHCGIQRELAGVNRSLNQAGLNLVAITIVQELSPLAFTER